MKAERFKVGDTVKIRSELTQNGYVDGVWFNDSMAELAGKSAVITKVITESDRYKINIGEDRWVYVDEMFEADQWVTLAVGDILVEPDSDEHEVYAVVGELVALGDTFNDDRFDLDWYHRKRLEDLRWTIKQDSPADDTTELSVAEIETKLGVPAGTLRLKKD